ncbi:MAG: bifunctional methylenetetrahydrofolate dehydrogenase/methenyltetrahydrofolate cyclohydrolase FolD [Myxococcaceae bacterium]
MGQLIDGKAVSAVVRSQIAAEVAQLRATRGLTPGLAVIRVGEDPASKLYVGSKKKAAVEVGFNSWEYHLPETVTQREVMDKVHELNERADVHGILIQLPLPKHLDADALLYAVNPAKDVDGFHPVNAGKLLLGLPSLRPCTPYGCMKLLESIGVKPTGKRAVIVGRSNIVGKPMSMLLLAADATVTICHRKSDLPFEVSQADILVVAAGVPELVKGAWVKPGATVIDVGQNRTKDGKLLGDVEFGAASERAAFITPVPGGVGPMTVAMLISNTLIAANASVTAPAGRSTAANR